MSLTTTVDKTLRNNSILNLAGMIIPLLIGLATIPGLIFYLGQERFGIVTLMWTLIGYFSFLDLGLGRVLTQKISAMLNLQGFSQLELQKISDTGLLLILIFGAIGGLVTYFFAEQIVVLLKISSEWQMEATRAFQIVAWGIPITTLSVGLRGIFEAYEEFLIVNVNKIILGLGLFLVPYLALRFISQDLVVVAWALILSRLLGVVLLFLNSKKITVNLWPTVQFIRFNNKKQIKELLLAGGWLSLSQFLTPILVSLDRFILSAMLGAAVISFYTVPFEAITKLLYLSGALNSALFPKLSSMISQKSALVNSLYKKYFKINLAIICSSVLLAIVLYEPIVNQFISKEFSLSSKHVAWVLGVGVIFNSIAFMPYTYLHASGQYKSVALTHLSEAVFYIPLLFVCIHFFGLIGAAIAWTIRVLVDCIILQTLKYQEDKRRGYVVI